MPGWMIVALGYIVVLNIVTSVRVVREEYWKEIRHKPDMTYVSHFVMFGKY